MSAKRALIVDDSKSARAFLSRILEKYEIDVETAESAEQAIEHLATHRPDVIFMDHLMPGMDGFQAVQLIKNNPRTATIPIMMYTSQEGELYLGQARALGAVGVLPKQIRPADVSKVLYQLKLVPDRRSGEQTSFQPLDAEAANSGGAFPEDAAAPAAAADVPGASADAVAAVPVAAVVAGAGRAAAPALVRGSAVELQQFVETAVHEQMVELRQFLTMSLDDHAARTVSEVRTLLQELPRPRAAPVAAQGGTPWPWVLASAALAAAIAFGVLWSRETAGRQAAEARLAQTVAAAVVPALPPAAPSERGPEEIAAPLPPAPPSSAAATAAAAAPVAAAASSEVAHGADGGTAAAAAAAAAPVPAPIVEAVPYGEMPLAGGRIEILRSAFTRAIGQGFRGVAEVRTYSARYCLVGNTGEGYSLAPEDMPLSKCDLIGNPHEEAQPPSQGESLDFANLVGSLRQSSANGFDVHVQAGDSAALAMPYPPAGERTTAGEWNRAAAANNRIEVRLRPVR